MEDFSRYFEANRQLWNKRTQVHKDSDFYNVEGFLRGEPVLTPIELAELGDVSGKSMLHLQCHFGMDSLDWVRRGAKVTGVDFSEDAIAEANRLKQQLGVQAKFICCNVYDLEKELDGEFDIVFTSYGVIGWLPDLKPWARIIRKYLKPGGSFYMAEFHPMVWIFDEEFTRIQYSYENQEVIETDVKGTYTNREADIRGKEYGWNHSLSEVMNSLLEAGLELRFLNEHMYSPYNCFRNMVETVPGKWQVRNLEGKIPLVYSLLASPQQ